MGDATGMPVFNPILHSVLWGSQHPPAHRGLAPSGVSPAGCVSGIFQVPVPSSSPVPTGYPEAPTRWACLGFPSPPARPWGQLWNITTLFSSPGSAVVSGSKFLYKEPQGHHVRPTSPRTRPGLLGVCFSQIAQNSKL